MFSIVHISRAWNSEHECGHQRICKVNLTFSSHRFHFPFFVFHFTFFSSFFTFFIVHMEQCAWVWPPEDLQSQAKVKLTFSSFCFYFFSFHFHISHFSLCTWMREHNCGQQRIFKAEPKSTWPSFKFGKEIQKHEEIQQFSGRNPKDKCGRGFAKPSQSPPDLLVSWTNITTHGIWTSPCIWT